MSATKHEKSSTVEMIRPICFLFLFFWSSSSSSSCTRGGIAYPQRMAARRKILFRRYVLYSVKTLGRKKSRRCIAEAISIHSFTLMCRDKFRPSFFLFRCLVFSRRPPKRRDLPFSVFQLFPGFARKRQKNKKYVNLFPFYFFAVYKKETSN